MQWITIATPPFQTIEQVDRLLPHLGTPDGLEARYVGTDDGQVRIVALWASKAHADKFFTDTLPPVLAKTLGPEPAGIPEVLGIAVARTYLREPVA